MIDLSGTTVSFVTPIIVYTQFEGAFMVKVSPTRRQIRSRYFKAYLRRTSVRKHSQFFLSRAPSFTGPSSHPPARKNHWKISHSSSIESLKPAWLDSTRTNFCHSFDQELEWKLSNRASTTSSMPLRARMPGDRGENPGLVVGYW